MKMIRSSQPAQIHAPSIPQQGPRQRPSQEKRHLDLPSSVAGAGDARVHGRNGVPRLGS